MAEEAPIGVRRVGASERMSAAGALGPSAIPPRPSKPARRRRRWWLLVPVVLLAALAWFCVELFQPFAGDGSGRVAVLIPEGSSASRIGDVLAEKGVVDSSFFFGLRARIAGKREELRSGRIELRKDMSYGAALDVLTTAPAAPKTIRVAIPEGRSRREIVPIVEDAGLKGDYLAATRRPPTAVGGPKSAGNLEGYLFPATYDVRPSSSVRKLVDQQLATFRDAIGKVGMGYARHKHLTRNDVVIIASMIEREAQVPSDRPLIAAVIYNRLHQHMPLGIDATLRFRLNNWDKPLKQSELALNSAYNTRAHQGLPPGPIGNPGLASLRAAAHPAHKSYLFYVVKPCGNGAHAFSSTEAGFEADVAKYNAARDARGGKDPSHCK